MTVDRTYTEDGSLLQVQGVNLWLGEGDRRRHILRDVDLTVADIVRTGLTQGQSGALLGPSGIGKTQLFNILAGFQQPDTGVVKIGKKEEPPRPGLAGVVTQSSQVFYHRTALSNLVIAGKQGGMTAKDAKERALSYLDRFGLSGIRDSWIRQLSGGQRQRLAILQQVMVGHDLILMDEPFSGLDVLNIDLVGKLINELTQSKEELTIIVVTHDIGAALSVADHVWLLGKEKDETGAFMEGARIVAKSNLIAEGLAWDPDIRQNPAFLQLEARITAKFHEITPQS